MKEYLIGEKLSHSYSAYIHSLFGGKDYGLKPLAREELAPFLRRKEFDGLNVTIPYKKEVIPFLDGDFAARGAHRRGQYRCQQERKALRGQYGLFRARFSGAERGRGFQGEKRAYPRHGRNFRNGGDAGKGLRRRAGGSACRARGSSIIKTYTREGIRR